MLIVMKKGSSREDLARVKGLVEGMGLTPQILEGTSHTIVEVTGHTVPLEPARFETLPGVARAVAVSRPFRHAAREARAAETTIALGAGRIGGGGVFVVAGPCAVESEEQLLRTARLVKAAGADALRGGAFKPRSSPYAFQGLGLSGLKILARAREETGLPIVTEAVGESSLELVAEHADIVQIGARNMRNYEMLKRAGRLKNPIFLKRGMSATL
jgi:3-deoxy-7-phosphoheptulonate synthase